jgi:hypothetical protein
MVAVKAFSSMARISAPVARPSFDSSFIGFPSLEFEVQLRVWA